MTIRREGKFGSLFCLCAFQVITGRLWAQESKTPLFELHTADGATVTGPLAQIGEDWSVALHSQSPATAKGSDVISLRRSKTALPTFPREKHVICANGDRIPGNLLEITGERLRIRPQVGAGQEMSLPLSALTVLWFAALEGKEDTADLLRRLAVERRRRDLLLLRNGDTVEGTLSGLSDKQALMAGAAGQDIRVDQERLAAIALNTALVRAPRQGGPFARLVLANGCRLSLASAHSTDLVLVGKTFFGSTVQIPVEQIIALDLRHWRVVYLSDLKPRRYEHTPFLGIRWPYIADGSVAGHDLRLAGSTYEKGLGMHSESRLTYDLGAGYRWFEALVGLDDQTGRRGSVVIEVLVDGKPQNIGGNKELTGQDKPRAIRVPVTAAHELSLVVKFGAGGDVQDHVDWVDAKLIK